MRRARLARSVGFLVCAATASVWPPDGRPQPSRSALSIAAVGDIMLGTDYPQERLPEHDGARFLENVGDVLRAADIAVGNLEGVLASGGEAAKACASPSACFVFRTPPHYGRYLREAGFDALSLANNHARDFGEDGRSRSAANLDRYGIRHSGRRGDIASWVQNQLSVAFIAFSPTIKSYLLNDIPVARQQVSWLASNHDVVIVSFHGGAEGPDAVELPFEEEFYFGETRGEVRRFAHTVVDAGADFVFGHGPHVPRALEVYRGRLIAYSLGNFATHWGVSVNGLAGLAPVLVVELDEDGAFVRGRIHSAIQRRPLGPAWDPGNGAYELIRMLTERAFGPAMVHFEADGTIHPANPPPSADLP